MNLPAEVTQRLRNNELVPGSPGFAQDKPGESWMLSFVPIKQPITMPQQPVTLNSFICILIIVAFVLGCNPAPEQAAAGEAYVPQLTEAWVLDAGLDRPESVIFDSQRNVLYVTNIAGDAAEMDGNGYIAKVSPSGEMLEQQWIMNLNAPKGIAIAGDRLWASDINALVEIDLNAGAVVHRYEVEGEAYLNDVAVHPDGSVFVTDSRHSKIYKFVNGALALWLEDEQIKMPNGAHVMGNELVVAAGDGSAENPGQARYFQAISFDDMSIRTLDGSGPDGALDAVEPDARGGIFTTDWLSGRLMYFQPGQGNVLLRQLGAGAADVDYIAASQLLYVPVMQEGQLIAFRVD